MNDAPTWDGYPLLEKPRGEPLHVLLPENGYHAVLAWAAGPEAVYTTEDRLPSPPARVTIEHPLGVETKYEEPRSQADQDDIDASIDDYLDDVGLPPRPRRRDWYLRVPGKDAGDFLERVYRRVSEYVPESALGDDLPHLYREVLERVVPEELVRGIYE